MPRCRLIVLALSVTIAVVSAGCVPVLPHSYFRPEAEGGELLTNACWGMRNKIRFRFGAVATSVGIVTRKDRQRILEWDFEVPEGTTVSLTDTRLQVFAGSDAVPTYVPFSGMNGSGNPELPLETIGPMVGEDFPGTPHYHRHYWLYASLDAVDAPRFSINLPVFTVDGALAAISSIRFTPETRTQFLAPIQC
jgi:hypothetical protein